MHFGRKSRRKETTRKTQICGTIILKWISEIAGAVWTGLMWLMAGTSEGLF
jgi:hypothetical protein